MARVKEIQKAPKFVGQQSQGYMPEAYKNGQQLIHQNQKKTNFFMKEDEETVQARKKKMNQVSGLYGAMPAAPMKKKKTVKKVIEVEEAEPIDKTAQKTNKFLK